MDALLDGKPVARDQKSSIGNIKYRQHQVAAIVTVFRTTCFRIYHGGCIYS
jgi:hypothetical protein